MEATGMIGKLFSIGEKYYLATRTWPEYNVTEVLCLKDNDLDCVYGCESNSESFSLVEWEELTMRLKLSEEFIRKFSDKVWWYYISHQKDSWSKEFLEKYSDRLWGKGYK
jgi:hypothetical protein